MKWNKIKKITNFIVFNTPFASISIAIVMICIVYNVASNTCLNEFYVTDTILKYTDDSQASVSIEIENMHNFKNGFKEAYWYSKNSSERKQCFYVNEENVDGRIKVHYIIPYISGDGTNKPKEGILITLEIVKQKITLIERILGDFNKL